MSDLTIDVETPLQADVTQLFGLAERYFDALYPGDSHHVDPASLAERGAILFVARQRGEALACGALIPSGTFGEIKRMFVVETARGKRIASRILACIEAEALRLGLGALMMETGVRQLDALALYRRRGFLEREPFGDYRLSPLSVYFEKHLAQVKD